MIYDQAEIITMEYRRTVHFVSHICVKVFDFLLIINIILRMPICKTICVLWL